MTRLLGGVSCGFLIFIISWLLLGAVMARVCYMVYTVAAMANRWVAASADNYCMLLAI